jgi:hypothetical protein
MTLTTRAYRHLSKTWKRKRFITFVECISPAPGSFVIDLGGSRGAFFKNNADLVSEYELNAVIADIDTNALREAEQSGFETIHISERGFMDFEDNEFDVVFCNSVIEHVTIRKADIWGAVDDSFASESYKVQKDFASSIERISRKFFVQTPHVSFPVESHTWLPSFYIYTDNRGLNVRRMKKTNAWWIKKSTPDFHLLSERQMRELFPSATEITIGKFLGFPKEVIAYRSNLRM